MRGTDRPPLPEGFGVALDPGTRRLGAGTVLLGGSPLRLLRLTGKGARLVDGWAEGARPVGTGARTLARRLVDAGVAHPRPPASAFRYADVTVVIPVRDRPEQLRRCLAALGRNLRVLVVDDASRDPRAVAEVVRDAGAELVSRPVCGGPGAARNDGLVRCVTPYVAFVDSDCVPSPGWLDRLLPHLADPLVAVVAPRIVAAPPARDSWLADFQAVRASLDLGGQEGPVIPGSRISYVPAAALVVRRSALEGTFGGFDAEIPAGEDVDLVWRLIGDGWSVRYEPASTVAHEHRLAPGAWLRRRFHYGTSAAPLALRHPGKLAPAVISPWSAACLTLLAARRPGAAACVGGLATALLTRRLHCLDHPLRESARLVGLGTAASGWYLAVAVTRAWWPVAVPAAVTSRRLRPVLAAAALVPPLVEWRRRRPRLDPVRYAGAALADDAAYAAGVWWGCLRHGTGEPLMPALRDQEW